jgi:16S rRNA (cytosine967-C5)-methyltransferase
VQKRIALDYWIEKFSKLRFEKIDPNVNIVLRLGLYQILYMDKVPASAACDESVKLARKACGQSTSGFVNGILRSVCRQKDKLPYPDDTREPAKSLSIRNSVSLDIAEMFISVLGPKKAAELLENMDFAPETTVRANTLKIPPDALWEKLEKEGVIVRAVPGMPDAFKIRYTGDWKGSLLFGTGIFLCRISLPSFACWRFPPNRARRFWTFAPRRAEKAFCRLFL